MGWVRCDSNVCRATSGQIDRVELCGLISVYVRVCAHTELTARNIWRTFSQQQQQSFFHFFHFLLSRLVTITVREGCVGL